jgi:DNA primase
MSDSLKKVIEACSYTLNHHPAGLEAAAYLDSRLLKSTQLDFEFGYFPDSSTISCLSSFINDEILKSLDLLYYSSGEHKLAMTFFRNHPLVMPYKDVYGDVVGIVGRSLLYDMERKELEVSKYKNTDFSKKSNLFGLYQGKQSILDENYVIIVEGQFDVIKAHEQGLKNIVALGNSKMSIEQVILLLRYTDNFYLLLDNDQAGDLGRKAAFDNFSKHANLKNIYVSGEFKDIDEFLKYNSKEVFLESVGINKYQF